MNMSSKLVVHVDASSPNMTVKPEGYEDMTYKMEEMFLSTEKLNYHLADVSKAVGSLGILDAHMLNLHDEWLASYSRFELVLSIASIRRETDQLQSAVVSQYQSMKRSAPNHLLGTEIKAVTSATGEFVKNLEAKICVLQEDISNERDRFHKFEEDFREVFEEDWNQNDASLALWAPLQATLRENKEIYLAALKKYFEDFQDTAKLMSELEGMAALIDLYSRC